MSNIAYPLALQYSLKQLICLPTVTHLRMTGLTQVPPHIPASACNLTLLNLTKMTFMETSCTGSLLRPRPVSLEGSGMDSNSLKVMDFTGLEGMEIQFSQDDRDIVWDLIQTTTNLEYLVLQVVPSYPFLSSLNFSGLGAALSVHALSTLKCLRLEIVEKDDDSPLCGLVPELSRIAGTNVLEEISLHIMLYDYLVYRADTEDWGAFDTLVTNSGSFPKLKLVSITILWSVEEGTPIQKLEDNLNQITDKDFPALLKNEIIEFRFSVKTRFHM